MPMKYEAPRMVVYGSVAAITGETGTSAENDWWLRINGDLVQRGLTGSIDACAKENVGGVQKCICADNGTC